jgi:hypothetical protein
MQKALAEQDAKIDEPAKAKPAFTLRDLQGAVLADPAISVGSWTKLATQAGQSYKTDTIKMTRRAASDFIDDAKATGHWQEERSGQQGPTNTGRNQAARGRLGGLLVSAGHEVGTNLTSMGNPYRHLLTFDPRCHSPSAG